MINALAGEDNICSTNISDLGERFGPLEIKDKLVSTVTETEKSAAKGLSKFKAAVSGDFMSAEGKYIQNRFKFKPYVKFIFAANKMPDLDWGGDDNRTIS